MSHKSIHEAVCDGNLQLVKSLLDENPALVNQDDEHQWRPIFHAGLRQHFDIVKLLIDFGADLSAHDGYVLHYAGEIPGNSRIVELLVQYGALESHAKPKSEEARQFMAAVFLSNECRVAAMLRTYPKLVGERYARGDTALHHACRNGDLGVVRILVSAGADINCLSDECHFPLYCAAGHCHADTTDFLLKNGAETSQKLKTGQTIVEWIQQFIEQDTRFAMCLELIEAAGRR